MDTARPVRIGAVFRKRLARVLQKEGIFGALKRVALHLLMPPMHRSGYVIIYPLAKKVPVPKPGVEIEIRELTLNDDALLDELAAMNEFHNTHAELEERLKIGELCYLALDGGRIVSYTWASFQEYPVTYLSRTFPVGPDEVYLYDAYTLEAHRGKGVNPYLNWVAGSRIAQQYNKHFLVGFMRVRNKSSMRSVNQRGIARISTAGYVKLFGFRFHYFFKDRVL